MLDTKFEMRQLTARSTTIYAVCGYICIYIYICVCVCIHTHHIHIRTRLYVCGNCVGVVYGIKNNYEYVNWSDLDLLFRCKQ